jgi:hypothetical protein
MTAPRGSTMQSFRTGSTPTWAKRFLATWVPVVSVLVVIVQYVAHSAKANPLEGKGEVPQQERSSPAQVAKVKNAPSGSLTVENESGKVTVLSLRDFAQLPRQTIQAKDHSGTLANYQGVSLAEVLRAGKVAMGKELKGALLANCLLVEASDGYRVVFSLAEIDPSITDHMVLVADRQDGKPLPPKDAPYRLVVPHDKRHARWVRQVTRIAIRGVAEVGARSK